MQRTVIIKEIKLPVCLSKKWAIIVLNKEDGFSITKLNDGSKD